MNLEDFVITIIKEMLADGSITKEDLERFVQRERGSQDGPTNNSG